MRVKVDENLPSEYASILRGAGFEADAVSDEKLLGASDSVLFERRRTEDRVLMTLDLEFADVQAYPPKSHLAMHSPIAGATRKKLLTATTAYSAAGAAVHGLMSVTPAARKGDSSRVATMKRRDAAMAAIWASATAIE